jgi:hypothetical protein
MKKILLTVSLFLVFATTSFAGEIPISGVAGCAPGLWYPESQVCVLERTAPNQTEKQEPSFLDTLMVKAILYIKDIF